MKKFLFFKMVSSHVMTVVNAVAAQLWPPPKCLQGPP